VKLLKVLETKTYYYLKMLRIEKFMNLKIVQSDGFILPELAHTSLENIVQIVKIVNEHNGHDQLSIHRKIYLNGCKRKAMENLYTKPSKILRTEISENLSNLQPLLPIYH
jgi:hypothetical protein